MIRIVVFFAFSWGSTYLYKNENVFKASVILHCACSVPVCRGFCCSLSVVCGLQLVHKEVEVLSSHITCPPRGFQSLYWFWMILEPVFFTHSKNGEMNHYPFHSSPFCQAKPLLGTLLDAHIVTGRIKNHRTGIPKTAIPMGETTHDKDWNLEVYHMVYHGTPHFGPTNLSKTHRAPNPKDSQLIAQLLQRRCIDEIHRFAERPRATRPQVEDVEICGRCEMLATITLVQTLWVGNSEFDCNT